MGNNTSFSVQRRKRIHLGIRKTIKGSAETPRLSVYRSNRGIYAQLIDDVASVTLVSASFKDKEVDTKGTKSEVAKKVGQMLASKAKAKKIESVVFDRSGYIYHGIIKSLADGAREGGLIF
ncbi:MAG: 50S ribosomal protein L18 [Deltaproteobacteria bacterium]